MIEIALPAGNLENAIVAFRNGADAVYFGMKSFSARKGAVNFSEDDLSKIRRYSRENGKKIYVTVNTLVDDSDLGKAYELLETISRHRPDGIIIQDLGLVELAKRNFPDLPLHGSTQLAVHNISGVEAMRKLGFERVVLSRELSFDEIEKIRKACPDIELKVFIHGAMCYGFSGLCMASRIKTGRSANEGECAQICRTWFRDEGTGRNVYPFSLKDLEIGQQLLRLNEIGIDSAKIEGRLKGDEYVATTARLYRQILDNGYECGHDQLFTFSRSRSTGFLNYRGPGHEILTTGDYTGHLGAEAGVVVKQEGRKLTLDEKERIMPHDGLMYLKRNKDGLLDAVRFAANCPTRDTVLLPQYERLEKGSIIYKVSDAGLNEKKPNLNLPDDRIPVDTTITVGQSSLRIVTDLLTADYPIEVEKSDKDLASDQIRKIFSQSGESGYQLSKLEIINDTGMEGYFVRSSALKEIRRAFLSRLEAVPRKSAIYDGSTYDGVRDAIKLPARGLISGEHLPWQTDGVEIEGTTYVTLPPVVYDDEAFYEELERQLEKLQKPILVGLNNIGQTEFASRHPEYSYFADIYLYLSNRESAKLLMDILGDSLAGGYLWMERSRYEKPWPFEPTIVTDFTPPLFISRACYRHDGLGLDCRGCTKSHHFVAEQNGVLHDIYVHDCCTVVNIRK